MNNIATVKNASSEYETLREWHWRHTGLLLRRDKKLKMHIVKKLICLTIKVHTDNPIKKRSLVRDRLK